MTKLEQSKTANPNYLAKIVGIKDFFEHPNPKCERLKCCTIDGYTIAVSIDCKIGTYVYFPIECQITASYLAVNNLFRDRELNVNKEEKGGFFEEKGRVKAIKLQGYPSEGFIMPISSLYKWADKLGIPEYISNVSVGEEFDSISGHLLCKKYEVVTHNTPGQSGGKVAKQPKGLDKVIENQFRFHYDTVLLKKCPYVISPNDIISITEKVHGTSGISANIICKRKLNWKERVLSVFTNINCTEYTDLWSSRSVIKNRYINKEVGNGYYGVDIWGEAHKIIKPKLTKGMTIYYEIIGYLPNGSYIQKDYDYGCVPPSTVTKFGPDEVRAYYIANPDGTHTLYQHDKHFKIKVYRITYTNPDGIVYEFSAKQVQQWCKKVGLDPVVEYYYGYAKDLYPDLSLTEHWHENFLQRLCEDKNFHMEELSPTCKNKVPHEGIVLKIENSLSQAYKVKCFKFLEKETKQLDRGESNIESES